MPAAQEDPSGDEPKGERPDREPIRTPELFENELPELRERLCWTQADLGEFFGVSKLSAHRWEKSGAGETEARKAALRLLSSTLERSPGQPGTVGRALLEAGVAKVVTAAAHQSPRLREGALEVPITWKTVFGVRERLGWTQTEFARFMGVTHSVPAVWESGEGTIGDATRAALLVLEVSTDPDRPQYREPDSEWAGLKTEGLGAFYEETCTLRVDPNW